jgi:hypothetical protein
MQHLARLSFLFLLLFPFSINAQKGGNYQFYSVNDLSPETQNDITDLLQKATSGKWEKVSSEKDVRNGIILKISDHSSFKVKESFRLESNGSSLLVVSSSSKEGLMFGIYKHLRNLGFKFYLPGDLYTIIPKISNPFGPKKDIIDQPFAQIRDFGGTGGFGSENPDPGKTVEKTWNVWRDRNGFGAAYPLAGARGEDFILENKKILKEHPDWLVTPLTGNDFNDQGIKLNYFNKEAVDFYVNWTIQRFTQKNYKLPPPGFTELVSIEPSDGGGFLTSWKGKTMSASDQVYMAANIAAKKLDALFPDHPNIGVNVYAYSSHAAPPSFPLHPRVFVQLVPYQFQNIAYGASFIKMWSEKIKRFGIYDYLKYADASWDLPGGMSLEETMRRLIHSIKSGSEGTMFETSYSKFSTGIPLWLMIRYLADGDSNWEKNIQLLNSDLYQSASAPIGKLFQLFYSQVSFSKDHLSNAVNYVEQASKTSLNETVKKRLLELKQYLYFDHLVYASREINNSSLKDRTLPISEYAWKIYQSCIVHSYRIMQLVAYNFLNYDKSKPEYNDYYQLFLKWFPETEKTKTDWYKKPQSQSAAEIENNFTLLKKLYQNPVINNTYSLEEADKVITLNYNPKREMIIGGNYSVRGSFAVYSNKKTELKISYKLTGSANPVLTVSGIDDKYQHSIAYTVDKAQGQTTIQLPAGETRLFLSADNGTYFRLKVNISEGFIFFNGSPRGILSFYKNFSDPLESYIYDPGYYPSYIFVPGSTTSLTYKVQLNALKLSSSGKEFPSKLLQAENAGFETRQIIIPKEESGKIWKAMISNNYNYNMINIPDRYFLLEPKK